MAPGYDSFQGPLGLYTMCLTLIYSVQATCRYTSAVIPDMPLQNCCGHSWYGDSVDSNGFFFPVCMLLSFAKHMIQLLARP